MRMSCERNHHIADLVRAPICCSCCVCRTFIFTSTARFWRVLSQDLWLSSEESKTWIRAALLSQPPLKTRWPSLEKAQQSTGASWL